MRENGSKLLEEYKFTIEGDLQGKILKAEKGIISPWLFNMAINLRHSSKNESGRAGSMGETL